MVLWRDRMGFGVKARGMALSNEWSLRSIWSRLISIESSSKSEVVVGASSPMSSISSRVTHALSPSSSSMSESEGDPEFSLELLVQPSRTRARRGSNNDQAWGQDS